MVDHTLAKLIELADGGCPYAAAVFRLIQEGADREQALLTGLEELSKGRAELLQLNTDLARTSLLTVLSPVQRKTRRPDHVRPLWLVELRQELEEAGEFAVTTLDGEVLHRGHHWQKARKRYRELFRERKEMLWFLSPMAEP